MTLAGATLLENYRKTTQHLMPAEHVPPPTGVYDIYPGFPVATGSIDLGFDALARRIAKEQRVVIDGYGGVLWEDFRERLDAELRAAGAEPHWICAEEALLPETEVDALVSPFLGGDDPLFGTRFTGTLRDFFDAEKLQQLKPRDGGLSILYGCGAALAGWNAQLVYVDLPKNEIQFRSRAGTANNLGSRKPASAKTQYKRFYFVDWVALNQHKCELLPRIDVVVDTQRAEEPAVASGDVLREALKQMSRNAFRVRPWFEPGPWGGHWIEEKIPGLAREVPNYAWSFELIVPENGLLLRDGAQLLEVSFDYLMFAEKDAVLGDHAERFGYEFPIRFDFLDTFDGGNLSLQCHPRPDYIRRHFGESFTQDETYYILDCKPGAEVYLGFKADVDRDEFREELESSFRNSTPVDVRKFVNVESAEKHDLFLIPHGTIHCSGKDNLVLEISATPYIFTFKMYDWMRLDLEGQPRPLNIDRAFENLVFERQGEVAKRELVSQPRVIGEGADWRVIHQPTHAHHFYDVHRVEFSGEMLFTGEEIAANTPTVMSLVEGSSVLLETADGLRMRFNYAETFVVPAAGGRYKLISENGELLKVVQAFMKPEGETFS